eukprot:TRINITY_DN7545_c0_g1_i1.p1 TRINITY_DN7545_c0_g1~~TRINITY_DN7545_c0_g1_i1.p1  ORF type:complete len:146 (-),score=19.38 TRINITY_DN7545_c0_g1_i1:565-1002(-)
MIVKEEGIGVIVCGIGWFAPQIIWSSFLSGSLIFLLGIVGIGTTCANTRKAARGYFIFLIIVTICLLAIEVVVAILLFTYYREGFCFSVDSAASCSQSTIIGVIIGSFLAIFLCCGVCGRIAKVYHTKLSHHHHHHSEKGVPLDP